MKNSQPSMQNSRMPETISATEEGTPSFWYKVCEPFEMMANSEAIAIMTNALSCDSHETVIAVNP